MIKLEHKKSVISRFRLLVDIEVLMKKIKNVIKNYAVDIIGSSIYDILKFLFMNCIGFSTVGFAINKVFASYLPATICITISIIGAFLAIILIILLYKKHRKYKFRILSMNVNFEYMGDKMIITTITRVRAKRTNLDGIYNRYSWFEDEKTRVKCLTSGMRIERLPKKDTSNEYRVMFGRKLRKGEEVTYKTWVYCENKHKHFKDFYSREIITPLDHLVMTVVVPAKFGYTKIERSKILGSAYSDSSYSETFDFLNTYTWDIEEKPEIGYEYKLLWKKK